MTNQQQTMQTNEPMTQPVRVGIDQIGFYTANFYLDLAVLAKRNGVDIGKYHHGIGQEKMSVPAHDEDIVTLAANAANHIITEADKESISSLFFATETGIDQSKAAGVYVHRLLGLKHDCRVVELKQACYSGTAAIQMACAMVARNPSQKVLVIASDVARYDLNTPAEATQGCGAVAMLIAANPRVLEIHEPVGNYTEDVMDFWRPNYRKTALVDGKFSTDMYIKALINSWDNYQANGGMAFEEFENFCYHLPFSRMGQKAHRHLCQHALQDDIPADAFDKQLANSLLYNRVIGNSYTASLYISLTSLLENTAADLTHKNIGFMSYGSGCVGEFFAGTVVKDYKKALHTNYHQSMLESRTELTYETYQEFWAYPDPHEGESVTMKAGSTGKFKLVGIYEHKRDYISD